MLYYLFGALSVLWIIDLAQTVCFSRKKGPNVERNPLARFLLKKSKEDFILFKIVDLALLLIIMTLLYANYQILAQGMLLSFIALYFATVIHNHRAQKAQPDI